MKKDLVTRHNEQKRWVRKNLHRGQPVIYLSGGAKFYAIQKTTNKLGCNLEYWVGSYVMSSKFDPTKDKIIKLRKGV